MTTKTKKAAAKTAAPKKPAPAAKRTAAPRKATTKAAPVAPAVEQTTGQQTGDCCDSAKKPDPLKGYGG